MSVGKPTTCKDAIRRWEEATGLEASSATEVNLSFQWPPIEKMDNAFSALGKCEKLTLSTNMIEKIAGNKTTKKKITFLNPLDKESYLEDLRHPKFCFSAFENCNFGIQLNFRK